MWDFFEICTLQWGNVGTSETLHRQVVQDVKDRKILVKLNPVEANVTVMDHLDPPPECFVRTCRVQKDSCVGKCHDKNSSKLGLLMIQVGV